MKFLGKITDKEIGENVLPLVNASIRKAARAVLFNEDNCIAIMKVSNFNYHKLPGGGIEEKEDMEVALRREIKEETGAEIEITGELGKIIEEKSKYSQIQESYCFIAKLKRQYKPKLTDEELKAGFSLIWIPLNRAISLMEEDSPKDYTAKFIRMRDLTFLKSYRSKD